VCEVGRWAGEQSEGVFNLIGRGEYETVRDGFFGGVNGNFDRILGIELPTYLLCNWWPEPSYQLWKKGSKVRRPQFKGRSYYVKDVKLLS
jgi:hypothetical protein